MEVVAEMIAIADWNVESVRDGCRLHAHSKSAHETHSDVKIIDGSLHDQLA
jgi:hypothetical protein